MPSQSHSQRRWDSGSCRKSAASMTGTSRPAASQRVHQPLLLEQPDVVGLAGLARPDVGRDHLGRVPDQLDVAERLGPPGVLAGVEVVGHVLGVVDGGALRQRRVQLGDRLVQRGRLRGHHLVAARVVEAGPGEVRRVEGLVDHDGVRPVLPGPHHRGRDVARARPHGHAHLSGQGHGAVRPATSAATQSAYSSCSRVTTGPRSPDPMVRPSTDRTGATPANVPVTNASCAL